MYSRIRSHSSLAKGRIIENEDVLKVNPEVYIGSWCGKGVKLDNVGGREGWSDLSCVRDGALHEVKSTIILQPGPALFLEGIAALETIIGSWRSQKRLSLAENFHVLNLLRSPSIPNSSSCLLSSPLAIPHFAAS